ncbi:MAG TPA: tyrosinase family protein [Frateuria sp.]|uniref:tyrosinase family protein n=1 Tax=Frateuria sp. TaxID=2211372 RepID=UPI002D80B0DF|nr:tyrosinase family protein [Frateuria sp.]HET6806081.1 tyrosinase family protein [Frateuria sp.]
MISRRRFLQSTVSLALVPLLPRVALSASLSVRPSWQVFCLTPQFQSFCNAVAAMKVNKDDTNPNNWAYWVETHRANCPHGVSYFLSWHRGFIYRFEAKLREISGDPSLVLPYWNYYDAPNIPPEFLDPSSPLYRSDRAGTDVTGALSYDAFADTVIRFQRGKTHAFETIVESRPHNLVHNLIGGAMGSIRISPRDPVFWVHHANIDRLWVAWLKAGGGRKEPLTTNTYWSGNNYYGAGVDGMPRVWTADTTTYLGYQYDNETMPSQSTTSVMAASALATSAAPQRPATRVSVPFGTSRPLSLDEQSMNVDVALSATDAARVRSLMLRPAAAGSTDNGPVRVVLDGVHLTGLGQKGGYFYNVYLNLPAQGGAGKAAGAYLLGSVGAFEISVAQMKAGMKGMQGMQGMAGSAASQGHGARLIFPATDVLQRIWPDSLDKLTVSFVRVDGSKHPTKGVVVRVDGFRVEADPSL